MSDLPKLENGRGLYVPEEAAEYFGVPVDFVKFLCRHNTIPISRASMKTRYRFAPNHLEVVDPDLVRSAYAAHQALGNSGCLDTMWKRRRGAGVMGFIYFITDGTAIKIGYASRSIAERISILQCGNPRPITPLAHISGDVYLERSIHRHFKRLKIRNEWFKDTPLLRQFMKAAPAYEAAINTLTASIAEASQ